MTQTTSSAAPSPTAPTGPAAVAPADDPATGPAAVRARQLGRPEPDAVWLQRRRAAVKAISHQLRDSGRLSYRMAGATFTFGMYELIALGELGATGTYPQAGTWKRAVLDCVCLELGILDELKRGSSTDLELRRRFASMRTHIAHGMARSREAGITTGLDECRARLDRVAALLGRPEPGTKTARRPRAKPRRRPRDGRRGRAATIPGDESEGTQRRTTAILASLFAVPAGLLR